MHRDLARRRSGRARRARLAAGESAFAEAPGPPPRPPPPRRGPQPDLRRGAPPRPQRARLAPRADRRPHRRSPGRARMSVIEVGLGERTYEVRIEAGLLRRARETLAPYARDGRLIVVTDDRVWDAQGAKVRESGLEVEPVVVPAGEASKSWARLEAVTERLLALGVERGDAIVAFGGGMVGDLAGFAAAILKRGCRIVQGPTTLLAQVDSSVGGKAAINAAAGKNLVGAFHQPAA